MNMSWAENKQVLVSAIELLERALILFNKQLNPPLYIAEEGKERYEYADQTSLHFQFLKAVRIVSGLNAMACLLEQGYTQEFGVLTRTLYDFIDEINYVQEAHETGKLTSGQKKIIDNFFKSTLKTGNELMKSLDKRSDVTRKEIVASMGRIFGVFCNSDRIQKLYHVTHSIYNGFVHGGYSHIMELYDNVEFNVRGMLNTPLIEDYRDMFGGLVHRSLNTFSTLAINFKMYDLSKEVIAKRKEIEDKNIYNPKPVPRVI